MVTTIWMLTLLATMVRLEDIVPTAKVSPMDTNSSSSWINETSIGEIVPRDRELDGILAPDRVHPWKWALFAVVTAVFVSIIPLALLYSYRDRQGRETQLETPENNRAEDEQMDSGPTTLVNANKFAPCLPGSDTYIAEFPGSPILIDEPDEQIGNLCKIYNLLPASSILIDQTGQLYHPSSGLIFQPMNGFYFEPSTGLIHGLETDDAQEPHANQVYHLETNLIYERCLFLAYDQTGSYFYLSPSPCQTFVTNHPSQDGPLQTAIRRLRVGEAPREFSSIYQQLLESEDGDRVVSTLEFVTSEVNKQNNKEEDEAPEEGKPRSLQKEREMPKTEKRPPRTTSFAFPSVSKHALSPSASPKLDIPVGFDICTLKPGEREHPATVAHHSGKQMDNPKDKSLYFDAN